MITSGCAMHGVCPWLIGCLFMSWTTLGTTAAASEDGTHRSTDANSLVEVMTVPGPPARLSKGYFANNPGCVSAKLDIWFARGRHSHQVFTMHAEQAPQPSAVAGRNDAAVSSGN
jgi:hypothetical protein